MNLYERFEVFDVCKNTAGLIDIVIEMKVKASSFAEAVQLAVFATVFAHQSQKQCHIRYLDVELNRIKVLNFHIFIGIKLSKYF